jgi:dual specificity phosphatase 12
LKDAFELIKGANKKARPNNAFVAQLKEYHQSLNKEPETKTETKEETQQVPKEEKEEIPLLVATPQETIIEEVPTATPTEPTVSHNYCCKVCRKLLFSTKDIVEHDKGEGQESFSWYKRSKNGEQDCTSYFIDETLTWMGDVSPPDGRLLCPKCSNRVGAWCWNGAQCSCG